MFQQYARTIIFDPKNNRILSRSLDFIDRAEDLFKKIAQPDSEYILNDKTKKALSLYQFFWPTPEVTAAAPGLCIRIN